MRFFGWELTRAKRPQTRFLGDLVKVDLSPGDVCVLMTQRVMAADEAERVRATWRATVGDDVTLVVLDPGMRLGVLSPPQAAAVHERVTDEAAVAAAVEAA